MTSNEKILEFAEKVKKKKAVETTAFFYYFLLIFRLIGCF